MPELNIKLTIEGKDLEAKLNLSKEQIRALRGESENFSDSVSKWGMMVTGLNQALEIAKKVYDVISVPIAEAGQFEQYETSLKVMLGSAEAAKARLQELVEFAKSTPFELPQVVQAANQLQAIGRYSQENLRMLGDLSAASGKPMEQALSAYAKMMTGQKGIAIDMFRDLLISTDDWVKATGAKMGKNGELQASVEQMAEALPKILKEKGFNGMMQAQSETFNGMVSNMKDAFGQLETALGQRLLPIGKEVATMLGGIAGALTPTKSNLDAANESAENQRLAFEKLVIQYESLRGKSSLNNEEAAKYNEVVNTLQRLYPDFLGNMDLQKGKLEDIRKGFENVRKEMEANIRLELRRATAKDFMAEQEEAIKERDKANGAMLDAQAKLSLIKQGKLEDTHVNGTDEKGRTTVVGKLSEQLAQDVAIYQKQVDDANLIIKAKQFQIDATLNGLTLPGETPVKPKTTTTPGGDEKAFQTAKAKELQDINNRTFLLQEAQRLNTLEYVDLQDDLITKKTKLAQIEADIAKADPKTLDKLKNERDVQQKSIKLSEDEAEAKEKLNEKELEDWRKSRDKRIKDEEEYLKKEKEMREWARDLEAGNTDDNDFEGRRKAAEEQLKADRARINAEVADAELKARLLLDIEIKYQRDLDKIRDDERNARFRAAEDEVNALSDIFNSLYEIAQNGSREEIRDWKEKEAKKIEEEHKTALAHARTQRDKERIDQQYQARKDALDKQADDKARNSGYTWFIINKQLMAASAIMSSIAAGINTMKLLSGFLPPPLPQIAMGTTIAAGLAQAAVIESQKVPGFETGGLPQGRNTIIRVNEKDQEFIANGEATRRFLPQLLAMNAGQDPFMMGVLNAKLAIEHSLASRNSGQTDGELLKAIGTLNKNFSELAKRPIDLRFGSKVMRAQIIETLSYLENQKG